MNENQKLFLAALENNAGNISEACVKAGIGRTTYYLWLEQSEQFKQAADEVKESLIDLAENKLIEKIKEGDVKSIIFFLKTKGKSRGYIERTEQAISGSIGLPKVSWTLED
jgi:transposase-like protein